MLNRVANTHPTIAESMMLAPMEKSNIPITTDEIESDRTHSCNQAGLKVVEHIG